MRTNKISIETMRKNVYGVKEIDDEFKNKIKEICFQQIKALSVR
ncbi:MAG: hypothetical protein QXG86_01075 [Candidatus Woesearchaeota archaeon]